MNDQVIETKVLDLLNLEDNKIESIEAHLDAYVTNVLGNKAVENLLDEIISEMRTYYIKNGSKMYEFSKEIDEKIANKIIDVVKRTLVIYDSFAFVREMELQDADKLLDEIFDSCILRRDLDYIDKKCEDDNAVDPHNLKHCISAFRSMIYDCVSKLLNEASIKKSLEVNTDLNPILINSVTQNINSNFLDLKLNYLINGMRNQVDR